MNNNMLTEIRVERLFDLGQYKNIKISCTVSGVPFDPKKVNNLYDAVFCYLFAKIEEQYRKYLEMSSSLNKLNFEDSIKQLDIYLSDGLSEILNSIKDNKEGED